jgi:hypothetical protein
VTYRLLRVHTPHMNESFCGRVPVSAYSDLLGGLLLALGVHSLPPTNVLCHL